MFGHKKLSLEEVAPQMSLPELKRRAKILVIDDDPHAFPVDLLRKEGYSIEYWEKVESMDRLERGDFDIIILDIGGVATNWGEGDGLGVLDHLKKFNPAQIIVAFSGQSFDLSKNRFWQIADDALWKPADAIKCKEVVDQLLQDRFNSLHYWNALSQALATCGVSVKERSKIEGRIAKALRGGHPDKARALLRAVLEKAELLSRFAFVVERIIDLCVT